MEHIQQVLNKLKESSLYANPEKCTWYATSVFYLGHEISNEGIRVSKEKISSITQWPQPQNVKELRSFLGLPYAPRFRGNAGVMAFWRGNYGVSTG